MYVKRKVADRSPIVVPVTVPGPGQQSAGAAQRVARTILQKLSKNPANRGRWIVIVSKEAFAVAVARALEAILNAVQKPGEQKNFAPRGICTKVQFVDDEYVVQSHAETATDFVVGQKCSLEDLK